MDRFGAAHRGWPVARPGVGRWLRKEQSIVFALMGSFVMVMLDIFRDGVTEGGLAEEDHAVEAFGFDGLDESLGKIKGDASLYKARYKNDPNET